MEISKERIRSYRLMAHSLDEKRPMAGLVQVAGACGLQNSPPGAWEAALFQRLAGCTEAALREALCDKKTLVQAWSYRGVPVVFPAGETDVFLTPLIAREGEGPWVYTRGISGALEFLGMEFDDLLAQTMAAARVLDSRTVKSKETLDRTLAAEIEGGLPQEKLAVWRAPSMYGAPDRQTVGGAAVSFLLRPCAFHGLVVFGRREGGSPTFTSFKSWMGHGPEALPEGEKELVRRFLGCYGPATPEHFTAWLGCSRAQGKRLWQGVAEEMVPVRVEGKARYMLERDLDTLHRAEGDTEKLTLLCAHDPYLDLRDRATILEDKALQRKVWQTVANPGALLKGGRVVGMWKAKALKGGLDIAVEVWEALDAGEKRRIEQLAGEYAAFRRLALRGFAVEAL